MRSAVMVLVRNEDGNILVKEDEDDKTTKKSITSLDSLNHRISSLLMKKAKNDDDDIHINNIQKNNNNMKKKIKKCCLFKVVDDENENEKNEKKVSDGVEIFIENLIKEELLLRNKELSSSSNFLLIKTKKKIGSLVWKIDEGELLFSSEINIKNTFYITIFEIILYNNSKNNRRRKWYTVEELCKTKNKNTLEEEELFWLNRYLLYQNDVSDEKNKNKINISIPFFFGRCLFHNIKSDFNFLFNHDHRDNVLIGLKDDECKQLNMIHVRNNNKDEVLLGMKNRGFGSGKYNGFGGKV